MAKYKNEFFDKIKYKSSASENVVFGMNDDYRMKTVKDYFGHEINKGDIVLYNEKASKGYHSSFTEGIIVGFDMLTGTPIVRIGMFNSNCKESNCKKVKLTKE